MIKEFERNYSMKICCHCKRKTKWNNNKKDCPECLIRRRKQYNPRKAKQKYDKKLKKEGKTRTYKVNRR